MPPFFPFLSAVFLSHTKTETWCCVMMDAVINVHGCKEFWDPSGSLQGFRGTPPSVIRNHLWELGCWVGSLTQGLWLSVEAHPSGEIFPMTCRFGFSSQSRCGKVICLVKSPVQRDRQTYVSVLGWALLVSLGESGVPFPQYIPTIPYNTFQPIFLTSNITIWYYNYLFTFLLSSQIEHKLQEARDFCCVC